MSKAFRKFHRKYNRYDPNTTLRVVSHGLLKYCTPPARRRSALGMHTGGGDGKAGRSGRGDNENGDDGLTISRLPRELAEGCRCGNLVEGGPSSVPALRRWRVTRV